MCLYAHVGSVVCMEAKYTDSSGLTSAYEMLIVEVRNWIWIPS